MRRFASVALAAATGIAIAIGCGTPYSENRGPADAAPDGDVTLPATDTVVLAPGAPGIVCAPPAPDGFLGPLAIYTGSGSPPPAPPACPDRSSVVFDGLATPVSPDGACTCACDSPAGQVACAAPTGSLYTDSACTTPCGVANQTVPSTCGSFNTTGCIGAKISDAVPQGSCSARALGLPPALTWKNNVRICKPTADVAASCPDGKAPIAATLFPYEAANYCILSTAVSECPSTYPAKRTYYDPAKISDERGCSACNCGPLKGICGGNVKTTDSQVTCTGGTATIDVPAVCGAVKPTNIGWIYTAAGPATNLQCAPSGGGPKGTFTAEGPVHICCRF